jgi:hypothetical protein
LHRHSSDLLIADAVLQWRLKYLGKHKDSPAAERRAISAVNDHLRNARPLFTSKAAAVPGERTDNKGQA